MSPRLKQIAMWAGYATFYLASLAIFAYVTVPYDRVKEALVARFNAAQTEDDPSRLEIGSLTWTWRFPGITARDVRLVSTAGDSGENGKGAARVTAVDEVYGRMALLPLLVGRQRINFGMDAFGGTIGGSVAESADERSLEVELQDVDAGQIAYLRELVGLPLGGSLSGTVELVLPEGKLGQAEGKIDLRIEDLRIGDGKAKIRDTIALPRLDAGILELVAEATEGRLKIEKLTASGGDLELVSDGNIRLMDRLESSLVQGQLRFRFSDRYKNKNDMTRGLFGEPGSKVPGLFDLDPKMKRAKQDDGFYGWRLSGALGKMSFIPTPRQSVPRRGAKPGRPASGAAKGAARGRPRP